jgi:YkoY family integral membrane protein
MLEFLHSILGPDLQAAGLVVLNLIVIESLLSVDNAAVLATMVMDLPKEQRDRALRYGIIGAYVFRGICLVLAAWLLQFWWLKPVGGAYLLWIAVNYFVTKSTPEKGDDTLNKEENKLYRFMNGILTPFWSTVVLVEVMDLAFSIDNVLAAAAYTKNIYLICMGVFIGILAMRFVAQGFVRLMEKYPFLETAAFMVIGILGVKLLLALFTHYFPENAFSIFLEGDHAHAKEGEHVMVPGDILTSVLTISIFLVPIVTSILFNFPKKASGKTE